eukprot:11213476-Lingulodinium_polyedra.AAC.1
MARPLSGTPRKARISSEPRQRSAMMRLAQRLTPRCGRRAAFQVARLSARFGLPAKEFQGRDLFDPDSDAA